MSDETIRSMWSFVFPFCNVQNYHGNLGFLSGNIIDKLWNLVKPFAGHISEMVGPIYVKQYEVHWFWYWVNYVTLTFDLNIDLVV